MLIGAGLAPAQAARRIAGRRRVVAARAEASQQSQTLESTAERFSERLQAGLCTEERIASLQQQLDQLYRENFKLDEEAFASLGRDEPARFASLLAAAARDDRSGLASFQRAAQTLSVQLEAAKRELRDLSSAAAEAEAEANEAESHDALSRAGEPPRAGQRLAVLIAGFESFNKSLYVRAARRLERDTGVRLVVFSDRDLETDRPRVEAALAAADALVCSLLFDYDTVEWLRARVANIPLRVAFECSLELMSLTQVGSFTMAGGKGSGPPAVVKALLAKFGSGREEDKMSGYISMLRIGPKLLSLVPGAKARHLRNWLTIYSRWNAGGGENVLSAFTHLAREYLGAPAAPPAGRAGAPPKRDALPPAIDWPDTGCYHPALAAERGAPFIASPAAFVAWHRSTRSRGSDAPVVGLLLFRKHVITEQPYIDALVQTMEQDGLTPLPIFLSGVEAHAVVRDCLTSAHEAARRVAGDVAIPSLRRDAAAVDCIVNTCGFPLVGGPAGSMEAGRQADIAQSILSAKNVPYIVAAPLVIQDLESWTARGVSALQSVVLYALPELDGAVDAIPLGGLVKDDIYLAPERVLALASRIKAWVRLRRAPSASKRVALVLYGFPPGSGAVGTAALLNVPRSLEAALGAMREAGYDLGGDEALPEGDALVAALSALEQPAAAARGLAGAAEAVARAVAPYPRAAAALASGALRVAGADVAPASLRASLAFPEHWGPSEWGPIPFLPDEHALSRSMERAWGSLDRYTGIRSAISLEGAPLAVAGLQLGAGVWLGVQPALGLEGDPMRLLFERDLTPHPQYAAFYRWLAEDWRADALVHFGMHGTAEWLPGSPLGSTALSWPDALLGKLPNLYIYAANNPSESILAKRRGFAAVVSHGVPPYGRAGLYAQLATLKALLSEAREEGGGEALRVAVADALAACGLSLDCPLRAAAGGAPALALTAENAGGFTAAELEEYFERLRTYLATLEQRLFSSGLHTLGAVPSHEALAAYLAAYFGDALTEAQLAAAAAGASAAADAPPAMREAASIRALLLRSAEEELGSLLSGLRGEYIQPAPGGDLLRDGSGALPTGRNIHALDPYRMPTAGALARGATAARAVLLAHADANAGAIPETVSVNLWGLDAIKTKGESVGIVLELVGALPLRESTGRIVRFVLRPLEELGNRPRVDVLCTLSGIFRDTFGNVVDLLDDMFRAAAEADEPPELNFVRKHALASRAAGVPHAEARLFSNPPGDYGSMVNERIGASDWEGGAELGTTWATRNSFIYGRATRPGGGAAAGGGTPAPAALDALLATTERVVQTVDSVEYGMTDIQEYYANTGALLRAARNARGGAASAVGCSVVEAFGGGGGGGDAPPEVRDLDALLRVEYRTKLLNPKWANAMAAQGSGGAYEISQRLTALIGWGATAEFADAFVYDGAYERYVDDAAMAAQLRKANPQAFANICGRLLEGAGRGLWEAAPDKLARLRELYSEMDSQLEKVG